MIYKIIEIIFTQSMAERIIPVIISSIIIIFLFILGRLLDSYIKSLEIRRNWYQKVIIDPNIQKVNTFYVNILSQSKESIIVINKSKNELIHKDFITKKTTELSKIKRIIRNFEFEFILMVQTNYPEIADDLSEHIRGIEDYITNFIDRIDDNNDYITLEKEINSKKYTIFNILYKPLIYKPIYNKIF